MLAMHPHIQEQVFSELKHSYYSQTAPTEIENITKLVYMEMVIKETMRLFPVGPFLGRECLADTQISS